MGVVIPAVLVRTRVELEETLARLEGLAEEVQVDVVDGRFAAPASWPYAEPAEAERFRAGEHLPFEGEFSFQMDLMVEDADHMVGPWLSAGATSVIAHVEATRHLDWLVNELRTTYGHEKGFAPGLLSFGLAIGIDTDTAALEPYLADADYVQFMGIATVGKQGQPFDRRVLRKIEAFKRAHPDMPVQVDGGVSLETAPELLSLGVRRLVVGSALLRSADIAEALRTFERLNQQYGRYA